MLYVASAIDPRFKTLPFASVEDREDTFMRLITETVSLDQAQDVSYLTYQDSLNTK